MSLETVHRSKILIRDIPTRSVTFGPSRATITREIHNVSVQSGANEIVIHGLDSGVDCESIKVDGLGPATITDMTTNTVQNQDEFDDIYPNDEYEEAPLLSDSENDYGVDRSDLDDAEALLKDLEQKLAGSRQELDSVRASLTVLEKYGASVVADNADATQLQSFLQVQQEERAKAWNIKQKCTADIDTHDKKITKANRNVTRLQKEYDAAKSAASRDLRRERKSKNREIEQRNEEKRKERRELQSYWPNCVCQITLHFDVYGVGFTAGSNRHNSTASSVTVAPSKGKDNCKGEDKDEQTDSETTVSLLLSYVIYGASWSPRYELSMDTMSKSGKLTYCAEFENSTSETWRDAAITLSTSQTSFSGLGDKVPKLEAWHVRLFRRKHLGSGTAAYASKPAPQPRKQLASKAARRSVPSGSLPTESGERSMTHSKEIEEECDDDYAEDLIDYSDEEMQVNFKPRDKDSMQFQETSRNDNGLTTNYSVPGTRTLRPSSLKRRHVLTSLDLHSLSLSYVVIPKRCAAAFLTVKVTNTSAITLLNGQAGLTLDGTFLGNTEISRCSPGAWFDLPLGIDPSIQINYGKPTVKRSTTGLFSKEDSAIFTRNIFLLNTKLKAVELKVLDQIPVSEDDRLRVEILQPTGLKPNGESVVAGAAETKGDWGKGTAEMKENGEVSWNVNLNMGMGCKLVMEYEVRVPSGQGVEGL